MAFLDRSTLIVDAVLTDKGREELSRNRFEITKFALGDDDVDYTLYNESNSNGPNFYGVAIDNMPVLEAFTNSSEALRYKLITRDIEQPERQPSMSPTIPNSVDLTGNADYAILTPSVINAPGMEGEEFIFQLEYDDTEVDIILGDYGQQQPPEDFRVVAQQVDRTGSVLRAGETVNWSVDSNDIRPQGGLANYEFIVRQDREAVLQFVRQSNRQVSAISVTGDMSFIDPRDGARVSRVTNQDVIYNDNGLPLSVRGSGVLTINVEPLEQRRADDPVIDPPADPRFDQTLETEVDPRTETPPATTTQSTIELQVTIPTPTADILLEGPQASGQIADLIADGVITENKRVTLSYNSRGRAQTAPLTIAGWDSRRTQLNLAAPTPAGAMGNATISIESTSREGRR